MKIFKLGQTQQTYHQPSRKHHPLRPQPSVFLSLTCLSIYISSSRFLQTLSNSLTPGHRRWKTYPHPSFAPLHHLLTSFSQPSISPDSLPFHVRDTQDRSFYILNTSSASGVHSSVRLHLPPVDCKACEGRHTAGV